MTVKSRSESTIPITNRLHILSYENCYPKPQNLEEYLDNLTYIGSQTDADNKLQRPLDDGDDHDLAGTHGTLPSV